MLTKKEYKIIERYIEKELNGTWIVEAERAGAQHMAEYILSMLPQYTLKEETEQGIDCDAVNRALRDGKIIIIKSEHGIAVVPGNIKTGCSFVEMGRHCGVLYGKELEESKHLQETMEKHNKGCYVKSSETEQELWDRLDGHQKCLKSASDLAQKENNKMQMRAVKSGTISIEKYKTGTWKYTENHSSENQEKTGGSDIEWVKQMERRIELLEESIMFILKTVLKDYRPFQDLNEEIKNIIMSK